MIPVELRTERLVLDQLGPADAPLVTTYCQDPLFERYLTTPWPYLPAHATNFIEYHVPRGWGSGAELTWAVRSSGVLVGVIALRAERDDLGFWLGAPFRGRLAVVARHPLRLRRPRPQVGLAAALTPPSGRARATRASACARLRRARPDCGRRGGNAGRRARVVGW